MRIFPLFALVLSFSSFAASPEVIVEASAKKIPQIIAGIEEHWRFLHERAREEGRIHPKRNYTDARMRNNDFGVQKALEVLKQRGHVNGTGKVLVLGGASETELAPLLKAFAEVHVADLSSITLGDSAKKYAASSDIGRLKLHQADLSGIPTSYQIGAFNQLLASGKGENPAMTAVKEYYKNFPEKLERVEFATGEYDLVLSLVLAEYLPYGPLAASFEKIRADKKTDRKAVDDLFGEPFFYETDVMNTFQEVFYHHREELLRLTNSKGLVLFSCWMRPDDHQATKAPEALKSIALVRVGDDRMPLETWKGFFKPFNIVADRIEPGIGPNPKSVLNLFLLEKKP